MTLGERASAAAAGLAQLAAPAIRWARPEIGQQIEVRAAAASALEAWGKAAGPGPPIVWLHGASAGELLGAAPAIEALRSRRDLRLVVTHFSPSGEGALPFLEPDFAGYPPLELRGHCERAVDAVRPSVLLFAKLDVWPGLTAASARGDVPTALLNAVVRLGSGRLRPLARTLLESTYASLARVGAASEEDAERLLELGVRADALRVTGDAAFDLAAARAERAREPGGWTERFEARLPPRPSGGGLRLVAGSTWPADEEALLDALEGLPATGPGRFRWQLVLAPHRPDDAHVRRLLASCRRRGEPAAPWSELTGGAHLPSHGIVVFDGMGRLAELYTAADAAYVGGALGGTGLHNVLEPAAAGIPVLFGPHHDRREARELLRDGAALDAGAGTLADAIAGWEDDGARAAAGRRAAEYVRARCGAGEASADLVEELLVGR